MRILEIEFYGHMSKYMIEGNHFFSLGPFKKKFRNLVKAKNYWYRLAGLCLVFYGCYLPIQAKAQVNGTANFDSLSPPPSSVTIASGNTATVSFSGSVVATDPPDAVTGVTVREGSTVLASQSWQARLNTKTEAPQNDGRAFNFSFPLSVGDHTLTISASNYNGGGGSLNFPVTVHSSSADAAAAAAAAAKVKAAQVMALITNLLLADEDNGAESTGNGPLPTISIQRTVSPLVAGQPFTTSWSTTNATSLNRICKSSGSGFTDNSALAISGTATSNADPAWLGYPSTCTWTVTGPGGSNTYAETLTTIVTLPANAAGGTCQ